MNDDFDLEDAVAVGTGFALAGYLLDRQTEALTDALTGMPTPVEEPYLGPEAVNVTIAEPPNPRAINIRDHETRDVPLEWDRLFGQESLKRYMAVRVNAAKKKGRRLPHTLLASKMPGVGKTFMAELIAETMGVHVVELVPPFNIYTIIEAAKSCQDRDIIFIDEVHKLADNGVKGAEILLKILEKGIAYLPTGEVVRLPDVTYIGATTDKGKLPQTIIDRFKCKPDYAEYELGSLVQATIAFAKRHDGLAEVSNELAVAIARACRRTPRIADEMVEAAIDLADDLGRPATPEELLGYLDVEPDGMTRHHIRYITALRTRFPRRVKGGIVEYMCGEPSLRLIVQADREDLARLEVFLLDEGLIDKTPQGRRLTPRGIARAEAFIAAGKGVRTVA